MSEALLRWCVEQLQLQFGLEASEDIVRYILSIETAEEMQEYVGDLLQGSDGRKGMFIDELLNRWKKTQRQAAENGSLFLLKESVSSADSQDWTRDPQKKSKRKGRNKQEVMPVSQSEPEPEAVKTPIDLMRAQENSSSSSSKKKTKFVNLYAQEGQDKLTVLLPGRNACDCLAQKHKLINNCISCGRIVCEQEGSGPCLFCGNLVCTKEEQEILLRDSNKSQKLRKKLMGDGEREYLPRQEAKMKAGLEKALQHKEKLLEFDRNRLEKSWKIISGKEWEPCVGVVGVGVVGPVDLAAPLGVLKKAGCENVPADTSAAVSETLLRKKKGVAQTVKHSVRRTQVLDDESDYFATDSNQWLSPGEREKLRKKEEELRELRHASRKDRKITLDFAGRQVVDEGNSMNDYYNKLDETLKAMNNDSKSPTSSERKAVKQSLGQLVNPNILHAAPQWVDVGERRPAEQKEKPREEVGGGEGGAGGRSRLRLQDKELQEMSDGGWCLSMHQPWASLLIRGIKRVEGRSWYSSHRGRLWIAAAAKKPTDQEVKQVESMYRHIYRTEPRFPPDYPTGCLLGCINVTDCLPQEQFRQQFPDTCEESASPFVFICTNPQELLVKFPMKGKHKIWKLESHHHQGARKGLIPSAAD